MGGLRHFLHRLLNVIRPGRAEASLEREVASHLLLLEDEYRRRGLSASEARRTARLALGGVERAKATAPHGARSRGCDKHDTHSPI